MNLNFILEGTFEATELRQCISTITNTPANQVLAVRNIEEISEHRESPVWFVFYPIAGDFRTFIDLFFDNNILRSKTPTALYGQIASLLQTQVAAPDENSTNDTQWIRYDPSGGQTIIEMDSDAMDRGQYFVSA